MAKPPKTPKKPIKKTPEPIVRLRAELKVKAVQDALSNALTGFGTTRSKVTAGEYVADPILTPNDLEVLFSDNDLAHTIVAKPVEDALRGDFRLEREGDEDWEMAAAIKKRMDEIGVPQAMSRGGTFGRLFGGAGSVLSVQGAGSLSTPLDLEAGKLVALTDWDRQDMTPLTYYPNGDVETYMWQRVGSGLRAFMPETVHASRLMTFPVAMTTARKRADNQGWDLSILQRVFQALRSFDSMFSSTDAMFADASQAVFKLQGLIASLAEASGTAAAGNDVASRLQMMDLFRSSAKAVVLDAGDETGVGAESFEVVDRKSLGTLDGVIGQYYVRLAAAARMPLTVLLGMAPSGMNATGESDLLLYFNSVDVYRTDVLTPRLKIFVSMVARSLGDTDPDAWEICWPELQRPKPLDVATAENMKVQSAVALITSMALLPEEVALSLDEVAPTLGITVNKEARRKALIEALKELGDREMTGPMEEPEVAPTGVSPKTRVSKRKTPAKAAGGAGAKGGAK